jgi:hypothetical protein
MKDTEINNTPKSIIYFFSLIYMMGMVYSKDIPKTCPN